MRTKDLQKYKRKQDFSIEDLVLAAAEVIPKLVGEQKRYKVTERPDIRTIRFYASEGVLDKPLRYEGTRAVYGYRHLLQLLAIKYFQSESLPIRKIREIMRDKTNEELEEILLPLTLRRKMPIRFLEAMQKPFVFETSLEEPARRKGFNLSMLSPSQRYLKESASFEGAGFSVYEKVPEKEDKKIQRYARYEIEPGLEINVSDDFKLPKDSASQKILLTKIAKILKSFQERRKE